MVEALCFKRGPEAFHGGIVVTTALATHTRQDLMGMEQLVERACSVLHAAIGVMNLGTEGPKFHRAQESLLDQRSS